MTYLKRLILLVLYVAFSVVAKAQSKQQTIDSLINACNTAGLFNGNLLVLDNGKEVYRKAIGYADAGKQTMLIDKYRFHIGSIAKEFNAVAIMMLQEQGKLNINDKITKHLTGLPAWAQQVSVKNLLQYTSGVPNLNWRTLTSDAVAMDTMEAITKLDFEPGTKYVYNNSNTLLQRQIVEKLSGMSFNQFVTQKMLKPLGMNHSVVDPDDKASLMAKSYNDNNVQIPLTYPITGWTAVTLDDFLKWERGLESFKLISPASTAVIITPFEPQKQCGLGGGSMNGNKIVTHTHDGTTMSYQALLTANVPAGRTVILMTNNKQNNLYDINAAIQNILDGKPYVMPKKQ